MCPSEEGCYLWAVEQKKTPVYVSGVKNTHRCLDWVRPKSTGKLMVQMIGKYLILLV
jgi:hypothetical protein